MAAALEETNKNLGALTIVTKDLVESREEEKKDASFFDVPGPGPAPRGSRSLALPRMGDAGRAGQQEDEAEGDKPDKERNSLLKKMANYLGDQAKEKAKARGAKRRILIMIDI